MAHEPAESEGVDVDLLFDEENLSAATKSNWTRLGVSTSEGRLTTRANKSRSTKRFVPLESLENRANVAFFEALGSKVAGHTGGIEAAIHTLGVAHLKQSGILDRNFMGHNAELNSLVAGASEGFSLDPELLATQFPKDEFDPLGITYQAALSEGEKNLAGAYYTPRRIVEGILADLKFSRRDKVLDPSCGSLAYFMNAPGIYAENVYAMDKDPIAVLIAKFNFFRKFPEGSARNICQGDFLESSHRFNEDLFDYIVTNPPWGAVPKSTASVEGVESNESFSLFTAKSLELLSARGELRFLLPESILNVSVHRDIRSILLSQANLVSIKKYDQLFTGVTTKYVSIRASKNGSSRTVEVEVDGSRWLVDKKVYRSQKDSVFRLSQSRDEEIISAVSEKGQYDLRGSSWAIGVVTGDNKKHLATAAFPGSEPIITGKEVAPFRLLPPTRHIRYERDAFQQVARDELYRADVKLVYKFISKKLTFAVDETQSLVLNSANVLIPKVPGLSAHSVAALLNSDLYQFIYTKLFGEVKTLKGNLSQLPFPSLGALEDEQLTELANKCARGELYCYDQLDEFVFRLFGLGKSDRDYVRSVVSGKSIG